MLNQYANSAGTADNELEKTKDSIKGRMNALSNSFNGFIENFTDTALIKGFFGVLNDGVGVLDTLTKSIGGLGTLGVTLGSVFAVKNFGALKEIPQVISQLNTLGDASNKFKSVLGQGFDSKNIDLYSKALKGLSAEQAATLMSSKGLTGQQILQVLSTRDLTEEELEAIAATLGLQVAEDGTIISTNVLTGAMTTLGNVIKAHPIMTVVTVITAVTAAVSLLSNSFEDASERAQEALDNYDKANKTLASNKETIDEISSDYEKLSKGVDDFGNNISLNTEEYKKYNEIVNKIADMFPEMVTGYTQEGNAIIAHKGNVEELTKAYEAQAKAARDAILLSGSDVFTKFKGDYSNDKEWLGLKNTSSMKQQLEENKKILQALFDNNDKDLYNLMAKKGSTVFSDTIANAGLRKQGIFESDSSYKEYLKENLKQLQSAGRVLQSNVDSVTSGITPLIDAYLKNSSDGYNGLSSNSKAIIDNIVSSLSADFVDGFDSQFEMFTYLEDKVIKPFENIGTQKEFDIAFNAKTQFNNSDISVGDYQEKVQSFLNSVSDMPDDVKKQLEIYFGLKSENGEDIETMINNVKSKLTESDKSKVGDLSYNQLSIAYSLENTGEFTFDELQQKIIETANTAKTATDESNITYGLALDDDSMKSLDDFQKKVKEVKSALEEKPDASGMFDLMKDFPLADWDSYKDKTKSLSDVLKDELQSNLDDLSKRFPDYEDALRDLFGDAFTEAKDSADSLVETLDTLGSAFKSLQDAYDETSEKGFKSLSAEAMTSLEDKFGGSDGWDDFYKQITEGNPTLEETRQLISDLANEYIDSCGIVQRLTEENKTYVAQKLEEKGITNALEVVESRLAQTHENSRIAVENLAQARMYSSLTAQDLEAMTGAEIGAIYEEMVQAGYTSEALYNLAVQKGYVNGTPIDTSGDNQNLLDEENQARYTTSQIEDFGRTKSSANNVTLNTSGDIKNLEDAANAAIRATTEIGNFNKVRAGSMNADTLAKNFGTKTTNPGNKDTNPLANYTAPTKTTAPTIRLTGGNAKNASSTYKSPTKTKGGSGTRKGGTGKKGKGGTGGSSEKDTTQTFDWIETKLNKLSDATKKIASKITDSVSSIFKKSQLKKQINSITKEITAQEKAVEKYNKKAKDVGLSSKYRKLVDNGDLKIQDIKDEKLQKKIEEYQKWKDKANSCKEAITDLKNTQAGLNEEIDNTIIEETESKLDRLAKATKRIAASITDSVSSAFKATQLKKEISSIDGEIKGQEDAIKTYTKKANEVGLASKYRKMVDNGTMDITTIKDEGTRQKIEQYQKWKDKIDDCKDSIKELKEEQAELFEQWANMPIEKADKKIEKLSTAYDMIDLKLDVANTGSSALSNLSSTAKKEYQNASVKQATALKKKEDSKKSLDKAKKKVSTKGLTSEQKKQLNSGKVVSTKGLKGTQKKNVEAYNKAVKDYISKSTAYTNAKEVKDEAKKYYDTVKTYSGEDYVVQNKLLADELKNKKDQANTYKTAYKDSVKNTNAAKKTVDSNTKARDKAKNTLLKDKGLSKAQKDAIKANKTVSTKGLTGKALKDAEAYNKKVKALSDSTKKYNTLLKAQDKAAQKAAESQAEYATSITETAQAQFDNIKASYDSKIAYNNSQKDLTNSNIEKKKALGQTVTMSDYSSQITKVEANKTLLKEEKNKLQKQLDDSVKSGAIKKYSAEWYSMVEQINNVSTAINDCDIETKNLYDDARENVIYKAFTDAKTAVENYKKVLSGVSDLIDDDMKFNEDGTLTDLGLANLGLKMDELDKTAKNVETVKKEIATLNDEYKNGKISKETYTKDLADKQQELLGYLSEEKSLRDSIVKDVMKQAQTQLDALKKEISARQKLLNKQKEMYKYDKTIKSKNKNIQDIQSQINALSGTNSSEDKSQIEKLKAQLKELQDDLQDTVDDHMYDLVSSGLDDLSTTLDENFEKAQKNLNKNFGDVSKIISDVKSAVSNQNKDVNNALTALLKNYGISASDIGLTHFAKGGDVVRSVRNSGDDGLASLAVGEHVLDKDITRLAKTSIPAINNFASKLGLFDIESVSIPNTQGSVNENINISCPITIEGNADADDIELAVNKMMPKIYKGIESRFTKDIRKYR